MAQTTPELRPAVRSSRRPAAAPEQPPVQAQLEGTRLETIPATLAGMPFRVLVVDDNAQVRSAVTRFLRLHAFHVEVAADGVAALAELEREPADFILLDVDMPRMNGFEVCRKIKSHPTHMLTPVIMLTALDSSEDRVRGAEAGCDGYLAKPVAPAELVARVKAGVRNREMVLQAIRIATVGTASAIQQRKQQVAVA